MFLIFRNFEKCKMSYKKYFLFIFLLIIGLFFFYLNKDNFVKFEFL